MKKVVQLITILFVQKFNKNYENAPEVIFKTKFLIKLNKKLVK